MNKIIPYIKSAVPVPHYKLLVEFEDGINGVIDLSKWKGRGVFNSGMMKKTLKHLK